MNLMNCRNVYEHPVLIDTWWNVNADSSSLRVKDKVVLIDTWWNVNLGKSGI